jgi:UDP-N-acetylmuramoyl-tripeptide--D-alanyl-D-alanine ligase
MIKKYFHQARRILAWFWIEVNPQLRIVGITGSFGKTNTTVAIAKVLSQKYPTVRTDLNLDTIYNLPMTVLKVRPWTEALVLEMGVDHKGEMDSYLSFVKPQVGVLTGITPVHSDEEHLGSLEGIIEEKGKLLASLPEDGLAILNYEDENVRKMAKLTKAKIVFYGKDSRNCDVWAGKVRISLQGLTFELHHHQKILEVSSGLVGSHHISTCMAAYVVGKYFGVQDGEILEALKQLRPLQGRMSLEKGPLGSLLLNDARRANPASTIAGLITLSDLPGKRKIAVLGEMGELGAFSKEGHRLVGRKLADLKINYLVAVGPLTRNIISEAIKNGYPAEDCLWVKEVENAAEVLKKILKKNDLLYLKGSLLRHMERVILILNGETVKCKQVFCHRYQTCSNCPNLKKGPRKEAK